MKILSIRGTKGYDVGAYPKKELVKNKFIYFFESSLGIITWAPYFGVASLIDLHELRFIQETATLKATADNIDYVKAGIYVPEEILEQNTPEPPLKDEFNPQSLTLMTTAFCNLRCKYCYARAGQINIPQLTFDAAKYLIDKFQFKSIHFHGWGEPTYNWGLIEKVVEYTKGTGVYYSISTNGVWFNNRERFAKFLVENSFGVTISYDGLPSITNKQRILPDRITGATNEIMQTIEEFKKYGNINRWLAIRCTVGKSGESKILDMCKHLKELGLWTAKFEPLSATGRSLDYPLDPDAQPPDIEKFSESLTESILWGEENGFVVNSSLFVANTINKCFFCGTAVINDLVLSTDLTLGACWEPAFETSSIYPKVIDSPFVIGFITRTNDGWKHILDWNRIKALKSRYGYLLPECPDCPVKCGGGCAKRSWENYGHLSESGEDKSYCVARRNILKHYLFSKVDGQNKYNNIIDVAAEDFKKQLRDKINVAFKSNIKAPIRT